jgi:hypothetical protein
MYAFSPYLHLSILNFMRHKSQMQPPQFALTSLLIRIVVVRDAEINLIHLIHGLLF